MNEFRSDGMTQKEDLNAIRRKFHQSLGEIFQLKQNNKKIQQENIQFKKENDNLKKQLQKLLNQISKHNNILEQMLVLRNKVKRLEIEEIKIKEIMENMQIQNQLLTSMKNKYSQSLQKAIKQIQFLSRQLTIIKQNQVRGCEDLLAFNSQVNDLRLEMRKMEYQRDDMTKRLYEYEVALIQSQNQIEKLQENQKLHREQRQKHRIKVQKYKKKSNQYKQQRNQLEMEIEKAKLQIGSIKTKKYYPDESQILIID